MTVASMALLAGVAVATEWPSHFTMQDGAHAPGHSLDEFGRRNAAIEPPFLFWQREILEPEQRAMAAVGVTQYAMLNSTRHYEHPYWTGPGELSTEALFAALDPVVRRDSNARILPRIFVSAPDWWRKAHPEECVKFANPSAPPADSAAGGVPRKSLASERVRTEGAPVFRRVVRALRERYGSRLLGLHVCNGPWGENFPWDAGKAHRSWGSTMGDLSEPMQRAFRRYLRGKYGTVGRLRAAWRDDVVDFETATVPGHADRLKLNADGWRDPAAGRRVPDYFECHALVQAEACDFWCRQVKEELGRDFPVVVFNNYTMDEEWGVECDHRNIPYLYGRTSVDLFSAPHTYHRRALGEDGAMRQYLGSAALHGKGFLDEGDDFTYLEGLKAKPDRRLKVRDLWETRQMLWREFGMAVSHGVGIWYMDLGKENFRDPEIVRTVGAACAWAKEALRRPREHLSEVVVISNPESEFYMPYRCNDPSNVCFRLYTRQMGAFYRAGAPFDWYVADDLDAVAARRDVKAAVLLDCQYLTDAQVAAIGRMKARGVRFLAFHRPGYVSQTALSDARSRELLRGMVHFPEPTATAEDIRRFYRASGVHLYTEGDVVLSANRSWVLVHAREAGKVVIRLPRTAAEVTNVVRGEVVARRTDEVALDLRRFETAVLLVGESEKDLEHVPLVSAGPSDGAISRGPTLIDRWGYAGRTKLVKWRMFDCSDCSIDGMIGKKG